jgi:hypothetical protein
MHLALVGWYLGEATFLCLVAADPAELALAPHRLSFLTSEMG